MPALEHQLRLLRTYALVTYPFACVPFLYFYFAGHGIDQAQYGTVLAAYYVAMFAAELPTGVLGDRLGPKAMLVLGPTLLAFGFLTLLVWPTYRGFLVGEILLGFGHASLSGPPAVLLYELLHENGVAHRYLAEESRICALRLTGTGTAFLVGGLLAQRASPPGSGYAATVVLTAALCGSAALVALRLERRTATPHPRRLRTAVHQLLRPQVLWLFAYWIVLFSMLRFPFHDYQPYLDEASRTEPLLADPLVVGLIFAMLNVLAAPLSAMVPRLVARFGRLSLFLGMPLLLGVTYFVMAYERSRADDQLRWLCWLGVAMFFVQQVPFGMHSALLHEFVNHRIGGEARTTVLSMISLGARLCFAACSVALFAWQQEHGIARTMVLAGSIGTVGALVVLGLRPVGTLRP